MVLAMHAGFAFLGLGTVRRKNQVNALVKILTDFASSTVAYFFIGYTVAYGVNFFTGAETLAQASGYGLVKFFFLLTFVAAIPAIVSGGIAERARFNPQIAASFALVAIVYPLFEDIAWNGRFGFGEGSFRRRVPRFRRQRRRARVRRLDRPRRGAVARRTTWPVLEGWRHRRPSAVFDSVPRARRVGAFGRLVRLQRHERADDRQDFRTRCDQFTDGDGRWNARRVVRRAQ